LNVGGVLEQYDTADGLLSSPASAFVASFLGRERGLRRLALRTVADIDTTSGPVVAADTTIATALATAAKHATGWVAVVERDELRGWLAQDDLEAGAPDEAVARLPLQPFVATVTPRTPLREALDVIVTSRSRIAAVVDGGTFVGMITIDEVAGGLE
jgi:osmoprotectant transport system ATP-binding protein